MTSDNKNQQVQPDRLDRAFDRLYAALNEMIARFETICRMQGQVKPL